MTTAIIFQPISDSTDPGYQVRVVRLKATIAYLPSFGDHGAAYSSLEKAIAECSRFYPDAMIMVES